MEEERQGWSCWLKGCVGGCGCLGLLLVVNLVVGGLFAFRAYEGFDAAEESSRRLAERFADQPFVPAPDGRFPPERVDAYLRARELMQAECARLGSTLTEVEALDENEEPTPREVFDAVRRAAGVPAAYASLLRVRAESLLEAGMSLEEFRFMTALVYCTAEPSFRPADVAPGRPVSVDGETHALVRELFAKQLAAARELGPEAVGADWLRVLDEEAARLEADRARGPWDDGLPDRVVESLEIRGDDLRRLHCGAAEQLLLPTVHRGAVIKVR